MWVITRLTSCIFFFFSSRRRHTRFKCDWSSDVCSSDLRFKNINDTLGHEPVPRLMAQRVIDVLEAIKIDEQHGDASSFALCRSEGARSEERRVGKECRSRWSPYH